MPPGRIAIMAVGVIVVLCPPFNPHDVSHLVHQFRIKCGRQPDRLRKDRCVPVIRNAMQRLVPVNIARQAKLRDCRRPALSPS